jgi:hypothetical protein
MQEPTRGERLAVIAAAISGLAVAAVAAVIVAGNAGLDIGLAVFALSWTLVAVFVLLVRFIYRRVAGAPAPPAAQAETQKRRPVESARGSRGRRRRKRR